MLHPSPFDYCATNAPPLRTITLYLYKRSNETPALFLLSLLPRLRLDVRPCLGGRFGRALARLGADGPAVSGWAAGARNRSWAGAFAGGHARKGTGRLWAGRV